MTMLHAVGSLEPQMLDFLANLAVNLVLLFVGIVLALWYENLGAPKLLISRAPTLEQAPENRPKHRFLQLDVKNEPRSGFWFVSRQTAFSCHGTIAFFTSDNLPIGAPMPIRWNGNPEPLIPEVIENVVRYLPDPRLIRLSRYIDIPPDETESLAIAVRIDGESNAYGWTGESYFHDWRHPAFRLRNGGYIARVSLTTGDGVFKKDFPFVNPEAFDSFDLPPE